MQGNMKCGIYYGIKDVRMEERPIPQIGPTDILIKNLRAGICGSDTGAYLYGGASTGIFSGQQFGHEMVGKVVEKGEEVANDIQIGDIVMIEPLHASRAGTIKADMTGGFSEYVRVDDAKKNVNVYVLDKDIDLDSAAIIEPVSVGTQGAICTNPKMDDKVVVLGAGTIGLSAAAGLIARGMKNVVVVDQVDWRLDKAKEIGAMTINTSVDNLTEKLLEIFGEAKQGTSLDPQYLEAELMQQIIKLTKELNLDLTAKTPDIDLVVDCAGALPLLQQMFNLSKHGTKYVIVAVYHNEIVLNPNIFIMNEPLIVGSQAYSHETILEVIDHITNKKTPINTIITKKFKHDEFPQATEAACNTKENIKVIIDYEL
ncbi:MAG: zinc-binding dehydrogenase [Erysipelotrichaceae bacterium]|nr:zinc-binding dehydrogenase [Erysipelotrichaceae bacterium]